MQEKKRPGYLLGEEMTASKSPGPPKSRRQKDKGPREAIVQIPLTYNDGTRVPKGTIEAIYDEVFVFANGWEILGRTKGAYRMKSGKKKVEQSVKISIIFDGSRKQELLAMVSRWAAELDQESILVRITDCEIHFVPPPAEEE
jgi:hypothetical protein